MKKACGLILLSLAMTIVVSAISNLISGHAEVQQAWKLLGCG
jgi:hypothetical protein